MRDVGAQHLICVSELGFPSSIEEKAIIIGPTVRLLTLKELETNKWPIPTKSLSNDLQLVRYDKLLGMQMVGEHLMKVDPKMRSVDPHKKYFRFINGKEITPTDLVDYHLFSKPDNLKELPRNISLTLDINWNFKEEIQYKDFGGNWVFLKKLLIKINLFIHEKEIKWEISDYEQRKWGNVAWVVRGRSIDEGHQIDLIAPIIRLAPGKYKMGEPVNLEDTSAFFSIGDKGFKAKRYNDG